MRARNDYRNQPDRMVWWALTDRGSGKSKVFVFRYAVTAAAAVLGAGAATVPASAVSVALAAERQAAGEQFSAQLHDAVPTLPVVREDHTGHERAKFRHWVDADKDSCDARLICMPGLAAGNFPW